MSEHNYTRAPRHSYCSGMPLKTLINVTGYYIIYILHQMFACGVCVKVLEDVLIGRGRPEKKRGWASCASVLF